ncbi:MAG: hypothetical protein GF365_01385|nr:hypothetical protein [Candidatus Buchananbacteria bacterium]
MKKIILCFIIFVLMFGIVLPSQATVYGSDIFQSGSVYLNYFSGYTSTEAFARLNNNVAVLDYAREKLVKTDQLTDKKILIDSTIAYGNDINIINLRLKDNCILSNGDEGGEPVNIGSCYKIDTFSQDLTDLLAMVLALQELDTNQTELTVDRNEILTKYQPEIEQFLQYQGYFNPVWSADSNYVAVIKFKNQQPQVELHDLQNNKVRQLENVAGYLITEPIWSPQNNYLIYASLQEIKIYNTQKSITKTIDLDDYFSQNRNELLLTFDRLSLDYLKFSADQDLYVNYPVYQYDLLSDQIEQLGESEQKPCCDFSRYLYSDNDYIEQVGVLSPDGEKVAQIYEQDGFRKVAIKDFSFKDKKTDFVKETGQLTGSMFYLVLLGVFVILLLLLILIFKLLKK